MKMRYAAVVAGLTALVSAGCLRIVVHGDPELAAKRMPEAVVSAFKSAMPPVRVATYNTSLFGDKAGALIKRLQGQDAQASKIAAVIQHVRPDIVLLNEFDYDADGRAADAFQHRYLEKGQAGEAAIVYPYRYFAPVNTGVASGFDLDRAGGIGKTGREYGNDAWGYGTFPGQYGMLILSRFPIDVTRVRTFRGLKWRSLPDAHAPMLPGTTQAWYSDAAWQQMPLSSKSHWDVPVMTPQGEIHILASHPTPPAFDGPENRNGLRNGDEIKLWEHYISAKPAPWLCDDGGQCGALGANADFVIVGDLNADAMDGDGGHTAMRDLLAHPRVQAILPTSAGAAAQALRYGLKRNGDTKTHTANFGAKTGTLRVDYVLPSTGWRVENQGVFWPLPDQPRAKDAEASDHHMVWADLRAREANL